MTAAGGTSLGLRHIFESRPGRSIDLALVAIALAIAAAAALPPSRAFAFGNTQAKLVIHLTAPSGKAQCADLETSPPFDLVTMGGLYPPNTYFAYILVMNSSLLDGVGGAEFGIEYDGDPGSGVEIYDWTFCGALQYQTRGWPASGTGNLVSFDWLHNRRQAGRAVVGYFYLGATSPDRLSLTAAPGKPDVLISDSRVLIDHLPAKPGIAVGAADFGGGSGVDPTRSVPSYEAHLWKSIQSLYRNPPSPPAMPELH
jgi:hypothetical protein